MAQPYDIVAIGECLIDFVCTRQNGKLLMEGNPGGAPANVLAMAARLGCRTALVSKVGKDHFGTFLRGHIAAAGIGTDAILQSAEHPHHACDCGTGRQQKPQLFILSRSHRRCHAER
ncbi:MAG: PfkB family carbohydrate kinase [Ruthenibacterium sp.]